MAKIGAFCGARNGRNGNYVACAKNLGNKIAERNHELIYGGAGFGLMGEIANAVLEKNGKITEIIPEVWADSCLRKGRTIITKNMLDRIENLQTESDAFITLPGASGTLWELATIIQSTHLGDYEKPIAILDPTGFYDDFHSLMKKMYQEGFAPDSSKHVAYRTYKTPGRALNFIESRIN